MTNEEKSDLRRSVRTYLEKGLAEKVIIALLMTRGFNKQTIKKYIKVFS